MPHAAERPGPHAADGLQYLSDLGEDLLSFLHHLRLSAPPLPPFSGYDLGCNLQSQELLMQTVDLMVSLGLRDLGYRSVCSTCFLQGPHRR